MNGAQIKLKIDAANKRLIVSGNAFVSARSDIVYRKKLNDMIRELSTQLVLVSEQNADLMRKLGMKN